MTATVHQMRKPAAPKPIIRHVTGCAGVVEEHGTAAKPAGLCVACGRITIHRSDDGLPLHEGATPRSQAGKR